MQFPMPNSSLTISKTNSSWFLCSDTSRPLDPGLEDEIPYKLEAQGLKNPHLGTAIMTLGL